MTHRMNKLAAPCIAPSILTADFLRLGEQIGAVESTGVELIHLDVMDGRFVPNISFGPLVVSAVRGTTELPLDVHLMIDQPERYIDAFASAGADSISIHAEASAHCHRALQQIRDQDVAAGIAINPGTPLTAIEELLPLVDLVLVMSVNPGFGGQSFIQESLRKIKRLGAVLAEGGFGNVRIEVDGGINSDNIGPARDAGAEIFVCGSSVFNERESVDKAVASLRSALS
ncbi:MAG: ribulose-phosphate 3-epimerase [Thermomicrobiaceae bacterium]